MEQAHYEVDEKNRYRVETPGHQGWPRTARPGDPDKYVMISADCHANEPGNLWRDRIDLKFRDRLPHVEVDAKGEKWFIAEGVGKSRVRARMIGDVPRENSEDRLRGRAGADPKERIQDQVRDGIDAEIIFPNKGLMIRIDEAEEEDLSFQIVGLSMRGVGSRCSSAALRYQRFQTAGNTGANRPCQVDFSTPGRPSGL
jgi:hypothetical protein